MLRDVLKSVGDFESYGLISMTMFVIFFAILLSHTISLKKKDVETFSRMPLDDCSKKTDEIQDI